MRAPIVTFAGLGHFGPLAQPEVVAAAVTDALLAT
jgi:pimeloyl-ACP methyl ester carboxylesterase